MKIDNDGNKIGADPEIFSRPTNVFDMFTEEYYIKSPPWLDVGSGDSLLRQKLSKFYGITPDVSDIDLDVGDYPQSWRAKFQTITSFEVIEHLYNPLHHLMNLKRVLNENGTLYIVTPNDYSLIYKAEHLLSRKYRPHFHQFNERDLTDILKRTGFRNFTIKKFYKSCTGTIARISRNGLIAIVKK